MPTGRKPKPTEIKRRTGNPGRRPLKREPKFAAAPDVAAAPPLPLSASARAAWDFTYRQLHDNGTLKVTDLHMLALFCQHWGHAYDAQEGINALVDAMRKTAKKEGKPLSAGAGLLINKTRPDPYTGKPIVIGTYENPQLGILRRHGEQAMKLAAELGLSPTSRVRLGVVEQQHDPLSEFMSKPQPSHKVN